LIFISPYLFLTYKFGFFLLPLKSSVVTPGIVLDNPQFYEPEAWWFYLRKISEESLTYPILFLTLISFIIYCKNKLPLWKLFISWVLIVYLAFVFIPNKADIRFILPIFPVLAFPFSSFLMRMKVNTTYKAILVTLICIVFLILSYVKIIPTFIEKIDYDVIISNVMTDQGNILFLSESHYFHSSSFIFKLHSVDRNFTKKVFRPCAIDNFQNLENFLNEYGIRYIFLAYPLREYYNINIIENASSVNLINTYSSSGKTKVEIFEYQKFIPSESTCNYICLMNEWFCSNYSLPIDALK